MRSRRSPDRTQDISRYHQVDSGFLPGGSQNIRSLGSKIEPNRPLYENDRKQYTLPLDDDKEGVELTIL